MLQQSEQPRMNACMNCRTVSALYFGDWGEAGVCRSCIDDMRPAGRVELLRHMNPGDRDRWRAEALWTRAGGLARESAPGGNPARSDAFAVSSEFSGVRVGAPPRERRVYARTEARVPVSLRFSPRSCLGENRAQKTSHCISRDISVGGLRVLGSDPSLLDLPIDTRLRMEVALPLPAEVLSCEGVVRNVLEGEGDAAHLGIAFWELSRPQIAAVHRYLSALQVTEAGPAAL